MKNQKDENLKKILIALVVLALFGVSYYYYANNEKQPNLSLKPAKTIDTARENPAKISLKDAKAVKKEDVQAPKSDVKNAESKAKADDKAVTAEVKTDAVVKENEIKAEAEEPKKQKIVIKPTDIKDLIASANGKSGKNDPFSYSESQFFPFGSGKGQGCSLPAPPGEEKIIEPVIIKGFLGNKVIADIKGYTESLGINETLQGIKVLSIDPANLTCEFLIDGKKIKKTMQPINESNKNVEINYITNNQ